MGSMSVKLIEQWTDDEISHLKDGCEQIAQILNIEWSTVEDVLVVGSYANNTMHEKSDIDCILVIPDGYAKGKEPKTEEMLALFKTFHKPPIHILLRPPEVRKWNIENYPCYSLNERMLYNRKPSEQFRSRVFRTADGRVDIFPIKETT